jgi:hypothetical protein
MVFDFAMCLSYLNQNGQNEVGVHNNGNATEKKVKIKILFECLCHTRRV